MPKWASGVNLLFFGLNSPKNVLREKLHIDVELFQRIYYCKSKDNHTTYNYSSVFVYYNSENIQITSKIKIQNV